MQRNIQEIVASQTKMLIKRGQADLAASEDAMEKVYETHLRKVHYFLSHEPGFSALRVQYIDTLREAERVAQDVNTFLGGNLDVSRMTRIVDEQQYRNRR